MFRDRRHLGAALPYVHTNPALGRLCREGDVVFVLVPVGRERGAEERRRREGRRGGGGVGAWRKGGGGRERHAVEAG